ncbi:MAG: HIRAN domain-containing protein [Candidatus Eremiobacterota bacterium]
MSDTDIEEVDGWEQVDQKRGGKACGYWLRNSQLRRGLVKMPRIRPPAANQAEFEEAEAWSELLASMIGKRLELDVQEVQIVRFRGRLCPLCWHFAETGYRLTEGADLSGIPPRRQTGSKGHVDETSCEREVTSVGKECNNTLLLVWKNPVTRCRYVIGRLWSDEDGYHFKYDSDSKRGLQAARATGFQPLAAFQTPLWTGKGLHPFFQRRLPVAWAREGYAPLDLKPDQPLEFFRLTGGRLQTDTFELLEPIVSEADTGRYELRFPVAGYRYYRGEEAINELAPETRLILELEETNQYDPNAIKVMSPGRTLLGYVPAIYSWHVEHSVRENDYDARVDKIGPVEEPQMRVIVRLTGGTGRDLNVQTIPAGLSRYAESVC